MLKYKYLFIKEYNKKFQSPKKTNKPRNDICIHMYMTAT